MRYNNESNSDYDILQEFEAIKEKMMVYKNEYIMSRDDLLAIRKIVLFLHGRLSVRAYEMIEYGRFLKMLAESAPEGKSIKISN